jgi:transposase
VLVLWLPPYSPDLNPIERFWKHLKATACANHLYASIDQLLQSVRDLITAHNQFDHDLHLSFSKNF